MGDQEFGLIGAPFPEADLKRTGPTIRKLIGIDVGAIRYLNDNML